MLTDTDRNKHKHKHNITQPQTQLTQPSSHQCTHTTQTETQTERSATAGAKPQQQTNTIRLPANVARYGFGIVNQFLEGGHRARWWLDSRSLWMDVGVHRSLKRHAMDQHFQKASHLAFFLVRSGHVWCRHLPKKTFH